jgi:putative transposase
MIDRKHPDMRIVTQCELLTIHRSSLYYSPLGESDENLDIMKKMDEQYFKTPFYGVLKLTESLRDAGHTVNQKRVRRLMKLIQWRTIYREPRTTIADKTKYKYPYLLKGLKIERKNQVWAMDITYVPMQKGFMYLTAIIDLHSRYVVHWSVSNSMTAEWCTDVLKAAIEKHGAPEIFNTDQGSQFTSELFINLLNSNDIQISMDGKGRAIDNIFIERLWRTVKQDYVYLHPDDNGTLMFLGLKGFFEKYNNMKPHQGIGRVSPVKLYTVAA